MRIVLPGLIIEFIGIVLLAAGLVWDSFPWMILGICLMLSAIVVHILRITKALRASRGGAATDQPAQPVQPESDGIAKILYADSLVTITENAITFRNYSLLLKPRRVNFTDIDHIDMLEPTLATGKWRMWGSGNFSMWFPMDSSRSSRDRIFHAYLKTRGMNIGFTVENSGRVIPILRSKGLIRTEAGPG